MVSVDYFAVRAKTFGPRNDKSVCRPIGAAWRRWEGLQFWRGLRVVTLADVVIGALANETPRNV